LFVSGAPYGAQPNRCCFYEWDVDGKQVTFILDLELKIETV